MKSETAEMNGNRINHRRYNHQTNASQEQYPMPHDLEIHIDEHPHGPIVHLKGDPGVGAGHSLEIEMTRLCARRAPLVILDLSELTMISSLVMGQFIALQRSLSRTGGQVRLASLTPIVLECFQRARLDNVFKIFSDVPTALAI